MNGCGNEHANWPGEVLSHAQLIPILTHSVPTARLARREPAAAARRPQMNPTLDLLKRASWRAECLFKQRGSFRTVLLLSEDIAGRRRRANTVVTRRRTFRQ